MFQSTALPLPRRLVLCLMPFVAGASAALALLWVAAAPAQPAFAATLTYPGCAPTIQGCIDIASPGETILISAGDYTESLTLSKAVSLTGVLSSATILHAPPNSRVLTVTGALVDRGVVISGLTFMGGHPTSALPFPCSPINAPTGGGILIGGFAQPSLTNLTVISNTSPCSGGGITIQGGSPVFVSGLRLIGNWSDSSGGGILAVDAITITNSSFQNNHASYGGGLWATSETFIGSSEFIGNSAGSGGGLQAASTAQLRLSNTSFVRNTTFNGGGGLESYGTLLATNTQFISNTTGIVGGGGAQVYTATFQGGLFKDNAAGDSSFGAGGGLAASRMLTITGTQFINNRAVGGGGGLLHSGVNAWIVNALFAGNSANDQGAAIRFDQPGLRAILFTTIASSTLGSGAAIYVSGGTAGITDTIISNYGAGISVTGGSAYEDYNLFDNVAVTTTAGVTSGSHHPLGSPAFVDPAQNDYHLSAGSAAIDVGINAGIFFDVDTEPRPFGDGFDLGFDELFNGPKLFLPLIRR